MFIGTKKAGATADGERVQTLTQQFVAENGQVSTANLAEKEKNLGSISPRPGIKRKNLQPLTATLAVDENP
jgi:hypothetical protein